MMSESPSIIYDHSHRRESDEHRFTTSDGAELFFRSWKPHTESTQAVILFHRGHEHSERWQDLVDQIDLPETWFFAWDARGHGHSPGERGAAESFGQLVHDADQFVRHVSQEFGIPIVNMSVLAQSVGAVITTTWIHDYAPPVKSLVIATPALRIKLYVPFAIPGLRLLQKMNLMKFIKSYVKPRMLTHDKQQARAYAADPLISPQIATNILLGLHDTSTRLIEDAGAIQVPTLMLVSGSDYVVKIRPQDQLFQRLSSPYKVQEFYSGFYHSTFWEKERALPIQESRKFIQRQFDTPEPVPSLLDADQQGYSKELCDLYRRPLAWYSPKRWFYTAQSIGMKTLGRLSRGIRIGWKTGFDSGESLDHVYRNRPEGYSPLGKWFDYFYLNSPGWIGIRKRKMHLQEILDQAIEQLKDRNEPVRILDIAAGPGRYILETIKKNPELDISALLCDRDIGGLKAGRELAEALGVTRATYKESDAFSAEAIASHEPQPNIAIVSGLYELFPENKNVLESLRGLAEAVPNGGFLIYTNQPWHPQQEMIARVLPNRDGEPWIMRSRTQAEMDELVRSVGFEKQQTLIDDAGIFTVSIARRA